MAPSKIGMMIGGTNHERMTHLPSSVGGIPGVSQPPKPMALPPTGTSRVTRHATNTMRDRYHCIDETGLGAGSDV
jgi:hypothetical protein